MTGKSVKAIFKIDWYDIAWKIRLIIRIINSADELIN